MTNTFEHIPFTYTSSISRFDFMSNMYMIVAFSFGIFRNIFRYIVLFMILNICKNGSSASFDQF